MIRNILSRFKYQESSTQKVYEGVYRLKYYSNSKEAYLYLNFSPVLISKIEAIIMTDEPKNIKTFKATDVVDIEFYPTVWVTKEFNHLIISE